MNIFKSLAVKDLEEATRAIPVIDFAPAFRRRPRRARGGRRARSGARARRSASSTWPATGCRDAMVDAAFAASREFHAMPLDEKLRLKLNENNIGYLPVNQSIQRASTVHKATRPNYNESFFISHDRGADHPDVRGGHAAARRATSGRTGHDRMRAAMVALFQDAGGRGRAHAARAGPRARDARRTTSRRSSRTRPTSTCASCTTPPRTSTTTSSSARARTPTTRSSRSWPARTCRASPCGCPAASGSPRR